MRKWLEPVKDWPAFRPHRDYAVRVVSLRRKHKQIEVSLEFLDPEQAGRCLFETLELPVRPAGLTAAFFAACGQEVQTGNRLAPQDCLGQTLTVQCEKQGQLWRVTNFEIWKHKE